MAWLTAAMAMAAAALMQAPQSESLGQDEITVLDEVSVEARTRAVLQEFVGGISVADGSDAQLARFDWRVCPGVLNMRLDIAQAVNDRIAGAALLLRLDVGEPGCRPNVVVIASRDVETVMPILLDSNHRAFGLYAGTVRGGGERLEDFRDTPRIVRWWHVTREVGNGGITSYTTTGATNLIAGAVIVVDLDRLPEVSVTALGDYIAMVALARLDPTHDVSGADTILNLFDPALDPESRPAGLTQFDVDYLDALYRAARDPHRSRRQESTIIWRMMRNRAPRVE